MYGIKVTLNGMIFVVNLMKIYQFIKKLLKRTFGQADTVVASQASLCILKKLG
jgi:hypothetical protein